MHVVAEAGDGAEALELYEQHLPDVMVLDLRMPKLDGAAVVQKVLEKHPKVGASSIWPPSRRAAARALTTSATR